MVTLHVGMLLLCLASMEPQWIRLLSGADDSARRNQHAAADAQYAEALLQASELGGNEIPVAVVLDHTAFHNQQMGRSLAAIPLYERALRIFELENDDRRLAEAAVGLSSVYMECGEPSKAKALIQRILAREAGYLSEDKAMLLSNLGAAFMLGGEIQEGETKFNAVLETLGNLTGEGLTMNGRQLAVRTLSNLAGVYCVTGRFARALEYSQKARAVLEQVKDVTVDLQIKTLANSGSIAAIAGNWEESQSLYSEAMRICERNLAADHPLLGSVLLNYSSILSHLRQKAEARRTRDRANAILQNSRRENGVDQIVDISTFAKHPGSASGDGGIHTLNNGVTSKLIAAP
jgi:tetratricopeptide (TPR) repeat protein